MAIIMLDLKLIYKNIKRISTISYTYKSKISLVSDDERKISYINIKFIIYYTDKRTKI